MNFAKNLRMYRIAAGYKSAKDFADLLGVPYTTYVAYENRDREPRYNTLCKIAQLLKVTPNDLLEFRLDPLDEYIAACRDAGFSKTLIQCRERAGFKQAKDFAKVAGLPYSSYSAYERRAWPNEENLTKIAAALGVSLDTLIGFHATPLSEYINACRDAGYVVASRGDTFLVCRKGPGVPKDEEISLELNKKDFVIVMRDVLESDDYKTLKRFYLRLLLKHEFQRKERRVINDDD